MCFSAKSRAHVFVPSLKNAISYIPVCGILGSSGDPIWMSGAPFCKWGARIRFWATWAHFGIHFGSLSKLLRFPGMLLGAPFAPRAAWINFELILGAKLDSKGSQHPSQNGSKIQWKLEHVFQWNLDGNMYPKWIPKGSQNHYKILKKILHFFIDIFNVFFYYFCRLQGRPKPFEFVDRGDTFVGSRLFAQVRKHHRKLRKKWLQKLLKMN